MRASTVTPKPVDWLWHPFIPTGKLTMLGGQPGQAKSLFTCWLAAQVSSRGGGAVMLSGEDDPDDTIVPRLIAAGADLDRVELVEDGTLDRDRLAAACDQVKPARLITIDPVSSFWGSCNAWKTQEVRQALKPLRELAVERKLAVLLIQHLNRNADAKDPMAKIAESQGLPQMTRSVLIWGPDPRDPDGHYGNLKALTRAKANLAPMSASATFQLQGAHVNAEDGAEIPVGTLVRGDDRVIDAADVVTDQETQTAMQEAAAWLRDLLAGGPLDADYIRSEAKREGLAQRTLDRAKRVANVHSTQIRSEDGTTVKGWQWELRTDPRLINPFGIVDIVGDVGDVDALEPNEVYIAKDAKDAKDAKANGLRVVA